MSTRYQVIIRSSQLIEQDTVNVPQRVSPQGSPVLIKAEAGQRYQLIDATKSDGMAPDWVRVKRSGKNLLVFFEDSLEVDVVIEDYYEVMPKGYNAMIGQAEVGGLYEYFPEDPDTYGLVPNLVDGAATTTNVVLGGAEIAIFELAGLPLVAAAFPWGGVLAAGAAGAVALGVDGGDDATAGTANGADQPSNGGSGGGAVDPDAPGDAQKLVVSVLDGQNDLYTPYVNQLEYEGSNAGLAAEREGVQLGIELPVGAVEGSVLTLTLKPLAGGPNIEVPPYTITAADVAAGSFGLDLSPSLFGGVAPMQGDYTVQASMLAPGADSSAAVLSNVAPFTIDTLIDLPVVDFDLDKVPQNVLFIIPNIDSEGTTGSGLLRATFSWTEIDGTTKSLQASRDVNNGRPEGVWKLTLPQGAELSEDGKTLTWGEVVAQFEGASGVLTFPVRELKIDTQASLRVWDAAGNTSAGGLSPNDWEDWKRTQLEIGLEIDEAKDGWVNATEAADGIQAKVSLPKGVVVGDKVQVELTPEGGTPIKSEMRTLTQADIDAIANDGFIVVTVNAPNGNTNWPNDQFKAVAKLYDADNELLDDSNEVPFEIDTIAPDVSKINFQLDAITGDDFVAGAEKTSTTLTLTGLATGEFKLGDTVTIVLNNGTTPPVTHEGIIGADGRVEFKNVKGADLLSDSDKKVDFTYTAKDDAGNTAELTGGREYSVEGQSAPIDPENPYPNEGVKTAIRLDPIAGDNIITVAEANGDSETVDGKKAITITGTVTGKFAVNDVVTLHVNNKQFTGKVGADGQFSINVPVEDLKNDVDTRVDAIVTGTGGDTATANQDYQFVTPAEPADSTAPEQPDPEHGGKTALFIDPITDDNIINKAESQGDVTVSGRVTGAFDHSMDKVVLLLNGKTIQATINEDGIFSVQVAGFELIDDDDTAIEGAVTSTDGTIIARATQNYGVITDLGELKLSVLWADDGIINSRELETEGGVVVRVTLPDQVSPGDKLTVNLYRVGTTEPIDTQLYIVKLSDIKAYEPSMVDVLFEPNAANNLIASGSINLKGYFVSNEKFEAQATLEDDYLNTSTSGKDSFVLEGRSIDGFSPSQNGQERIYNGDVDRHIVIGSVNGNFFNGKVVTDIGNDWIYGGAGNDIIIGGSGRNTLTGGAGSDTFKYNPNSLGAVDTITDFTFGTADQEKDVLKLKDLFTNDLGTNLSSYIDFDVITEGDSKTVQLRIHTDGNKSTPADIQISLINQSNAFDWTLQQMIDNGNIVVE